MPRRFFPTFLSPSILRRKGAALVEYGLLVGLIAVLAIASVFQLGGTVQGIFTEVGSTLSNRVLVNASITPPAGPGTPTTTDANCYNPAHIGTVGQAGWTGCAGMLIVDNVMFLAAGGDLVGGNQSYQVTGPGGVIYTYADGPNTIFTGQVTTMSALFALGSFNGDISHWDTSNVTDMSSMFFSNTVFNQDISGWDVSQVTNMAGMFIDTTAFNQPIGVWDVSNVTNFAQTFYQNHTFNQPLAAWDTSSAQDMSSMFEMNTAFNQDISGWNTSNVTTMDLMFFENTAFSQDISGWCVTNIPTPPASFDTDSLLATTPAFRPVWGSCVP